MMENMLENMKTEAGGPLIDRTGRRFPRSIEGAEQLMNHADEQVVFPAKMHVEGGTANVGAIQYLLYSDLLVRPFASERGQRLMQQPPGLFNPAIFLLFPV
jgi:hypothetical protein